VKIKGVELRQTCGACPEQYDAYLDGAYFGYFRLRHGYFRVEDVTGKTVYDAHPQGDGLFEEHEREKFLTEGVNALLGTKEPLRDAAENVVIAYGMGWDMDGVIDQLERALNQ
jgi:hypothetical protein